MKRVVITQSASGTILIIVPLKMTYTSSRMLTLINDALYNNKVCPIIRKWQLGSERDIGKEGLPRRALHGLLTSNVVNRILAFNLWVCRHLV